MALETPSPLLGLPTELLLITLDLLCEPPLLPFRCGEEKEPPMSYSIRHIRSLSLVNRQLRQICLPLLFSSLKFTNEQRQQLCLLETKCTEDIKFAGLIRKLNLTDIYAPCDILPSLVSRLRSLEWLDVDADQIDANLLAILNSHPHLKTVAVCDTYLDTLTNLIPLTSLSLSKILIPSARLECFLELQSPALLALMDRSPRLAHLVLRGETNIKAGAGALFIPGLDVLDIGVYLTPTSVMSWLPAFAERHNSLTTITFSGDQYGSSWSRNPDILFPLQFIDAVEREALGCTVALNAFSISRAGSTSFNSWPVSALELKLEKAAGISVLRIASALTPRLSSLSIRISSRGRHPIPIDDLVLALGCFPLLCRLNLHGIYKHLLVEGPAPWEVPPADTERETSNCMVAHAALHWIVARVAQCAPTLQLVHFMDQGFDGKGRLLHPWLLKATYQLRRTPSGFEFHGTPQFVMAPRFSVPQ